ncbi:20376_t:CDS:1, partial [Gigaspora rosea]
DQAIGDSSLLNLPYASRKHQTSVKEIRELSSLSLIWLGSYVSIALSKKQQI